MAFEGNQARTMGEIEVIDDVQMAFNETCTPCKCKICGGGYCMVNVYTNDRGQVTRVLPDPYWPGSMENCIRMKNEGRAALEYHFHPERLNYPLKRVGERGEGKWEIISWDQALKECGDKLNELRDKYGAETLAHLGGTGHYPDYVWTKSRFGNIFGTPNCVGNENICHGPYTKAAEITTGWDARPDMNPGGLDLCVLASNARESAPAGLTTIADMKKAGCKIITLNPEFNNCARYADRFLQIRPGSDGALYLAWIHVIMAEDLYDHDFVSEWCSGFEGLWDVVKEWTPEKAAEVTWLTPDAIRETARMFAAAPRAAVYTCEVYEGQAPNGFRTLRAMFILHAITGNIDNGMYCNGPYPNTKIVDEFEMERFDLLPESQSMKQAGIERFKMMNHIGWSLVGENEQKRFGTQFYGYWLNQANSATVWKQMVTGKPYPIKAAILTGCGAITKYSNSKAVYEGLKNLELLIVADLFHNPQTMLADYVFPMSDWMERPMLEADNAHLMGVLAGSMNATEAMYERRSDYDMFKGLAEHTGQGEYWPWENLEEVYDWRLQRQGKTFKEFAAQRADVEAYEANTYKKINPRTGEVNGFATPTGKIEIKSVLLEQLGYDPITHYEEPNFSHISTPEYAEKYPLILLSGRRTQPFYHSEHRQIRTFRDLHPDPLVYVSNETAENMYPPIHDGDWVWLENHMGRVKFRARLTTALQPGVVSAEHNWWFPEEDPTDPNLFGAFKSNINVILDDDPDISGQEMGSYTCKNALCRMYKA